MEENIEINKPNGGDLNDIKEILSQWTDKEELNKYIERIDNEIKGKTEYNMQFWVVREGGKPVGIIGLSNLLPKVLFLAKTKKPAEIKILYLENNHRGKGLGKKLVSFVEDEAKKQGYSELIARSSMKYKETAFGFYERLGYAKMAEINNDEENKIMAVFEKVLI